MSTELMEIGEHCSFCGQLDFLPFKCECMKTFCAEHRQPAIHQCSFIAEQDAKASPQHVSGGRKNTDAAIKALLPERSSVRMKQYNEQQQAQQQQAKGNNLNSLIQNNQSAMAKLKSFFASNSKPSRPVTNNKTKQMIELSKLKAASKGDGKIPVSERIYVYVQVIDDDSSSAAQNVRHPVFISRAHPIGRALDQLAAQFGLRNVNNRSSDESQKLFLFKQVQEAGAEFQKLGFSDRCSSVHNCDVLCLVRGNFQT